jgi:hypothetical protein
MTECWINVYDDYWLGLLQHSSRYAAMEMAAHSLKVYNRRVIYRLRVRVRDQ